MAKAAQGARTRIRPTASIAKIHAPGIHSLTLAQVTHTRTRASSVPENDTRCRASDALKHCDTEAANAFF